MHRRNRCMTDAADSKTGSDRGLAPGRESGRSNAVPDAGRAETAGRLRADDIVSDVRQEGEML